MDAVTRWRALGAAVLLASILTACSDDADPQAAATATPPPATTPAMAVGSGTSTPSPSSMPAAAAPATGGAGAAQVVQQVRGSVALIRAGTAAPAGPFGGRGGGAGTGSGFVIDARGYIVTNNHVVTLGTDTPASRFEVSLADGRTTSATLVGRDARTDLAVLKVEVADLTALRWAEPASIQVGQAVVAIGFPLDLGAAPTVTTGVVSATDRVINETLAIEGRPYRIDISGAIQTDAAINPGNSGGPLLNLQGEVVGINTAGLTSAGGQPVQGIFFAVGAQVARPIVQALIAEGSVERGYLGVQVASVTREVARATNLPVDAGAAVVSAEAGSPAARAGVRPGDVIVTVGDQAIANTGDLTRALFRYQPGTTVPVEVVRQGQRQTVAVTLDRRPTGAE
jgi:serine protease Do